MHYVFIIHEGNLEIKALILAASLRFVHSDNINLTCAVLSNQNQLVLNKKSINCLNELKIQIQPFQNPLFSEYKKAKYYQLYANKLFAIRACSNGSDLVFLDSDMICLNNISSYKSEKSIELRAAGYMSIRNWERIYKDLNLQLPKVKFRGVLDGELSYPYFNAGFIALKHDIQNDLITEWVNYFHKAGSLSFLKSNIKNLDQISLALAIQAMGLEYNEIPIDINYPILKDYSFSTFKPRLIHYHHPRNFKQNLDCLRQLNELVNSFPFLSTYLKSNPEWAKILMQAM